MFNRVYNYLLRYYYYSSVTVNVTVTVTVTIPNTFKLRASVLPLFENKIKFTYNHYELLFGEMLCYGSDIFR